MKKSLLALLVSTLLATFARPADAQEIVVKLATAAPTGSPWHEMLKEVATRWRDLSGGRVSVKVFVGGTMGDETDIVKKVRIGQAQAAALSTVGLHDITPEPLALDLPMLAANDAEHAFLVETMAPSLEQALLAKGYVVLAWSEAGFAHFVSTKSRPTLPEARKVKLAVWAGDPGSSSAWKAGGFAPVTLSSTDIVPSLQTGAIDTVLLPPAVALGSVKFDKAKFLMAPPFATLTGALVIDKKTWESIPADLQAPLRKVAREIATAGAARVRKANADALAALKKAGGSVVNLSDAAKWREMLDSPAVTAELRGKVVPAATYDEAYAVIRTYRATHK